MKPLRLANIAVDQLKNEIELVNTRFVDLKHEVDSVYKVYTDFLEKNNKENMKLEQFWVDEPNQGTV
jgi:hypothetical protein